MPTQFYVQNNFTHGELDPRLFAGTNLEYYYKSLTKARNVYVRPQGGIKKRHGTEYMETLSSEFGEYKLGSFIFDEDHEFLFIFVELKILIRKVQSDGSFEKGYEVTTTYTKDQIPDIQFAQNGNLMVIVHPDVAPQALTWNSSTSAWSTLAALPIKNQPAYDFAKDYYEDKFGLSDVTIGVNRTLTCSRAIFTNDYVGGIFISLGATLTEPIGLARIRSVGSATAIATCAVDIIFAFDLSLKPAATPEILGSSCFLGQPAFSATKGWPLSVTFYEDRLIFGATELLPQTLFMSRIGAFNDFDQGDSSADDAIIYTLSSSEYNRIKYMTSNQSLQIFCYESAFATVQEFGIPIAPGSVGIRKQAPYGISDIKPLVIDNQTFYVREGGNAVLAFVFDPNTATYNSLNSSIFSAHLIRNPIAGTVLKGDELEDADYMFLINEEGTLVVYQSLSEQNVSAWTLCVTGPDNTTLSDVSASHSKYRDIVNVRNKIYAVVERTIEGIQVQYLERFSFDYKTDSSTLIITPHKTNELTGLSHLIGERVRVVGDDRVLRVDNSVNDGKVSTTGTLTLLDEAKEFRVGLNFNLLAETIPANLAGQGKIYVPKKIVRLWIDYYESIGIKVGGKFIPELTFGPSTLDQPAKPKTGIFQTTGNSWGARETIKITQEDPLPFLVIGLGFEVTT